MSQPPMIRKRQIEEDDDAAIDDTPQFADKETMAQRRVVRVKRSDSATAPSFKGAFNFAQNAVAGDAPSLFTNFGKIGATGTSGGDDSSAPFSFMSKTNTSGSTSATPGTAFSFGTKQTDDAKPAAPKFSFGSVPADEAAPKFSFGSVPADEAAPKFSFGVGTAKDGESAAPLFKFGDAVNSFVAARKRIEEQRAAEETESGGVDGDADEGEDNSDPSESNNAFASATSAVVASGDVLASIPSKLYTFKKGTQTWVECGAGEAKVKRHERSKEEQSLETSFVYRLIVRDGYSLNALLNGNFKLYKTEENYAIFAALDGNGMTTYLLKYTGHQLAERGGEFSKVLKETLQLAVSDGEKDKKE